MLLYGPLIPSPAAPLPRSAGVIPVVLLATHYCLHHTHRIGLFPHRTPTACFSVRVHQYHCNGLIYDKKLCTSPHNSNIPCTRCNRRLRRSRYISCCKARPCLRYKVYSKSTGDHGSFRLSFFPLLLFRHRPVQRYERRHLVLEARFQATLDVC